MPVSLAGSYLERVVAPMEASLEMRMASARTGQVECMRLLLFSQAVALSSSACSTWCLGKRLRVKGGGFRHVAWVWVGVRVIVVVLGVCVGFVVGRGSCVVVNRAVGCLQRKQVHCAVFIDSNEWLVIVM